jgi:hypothetical protein
MDAAFGDWLLRSGDGGERGLGAIGERKKTGVEAGAVRHFAL